MFGEERHVRIDVEYFRILAWAHALEMIGPNRSRLIESRVSDGHGVPVTLFNERLKLSGERRVKERFDFRIHLRALW